jgi:hypothetical protein
VALRPLSYLAQVADYEGGGEGLSRNTLTTVIFVVLLIVLVVLLLRLVL